MTKTPFTRRQVAAIILSERMLKDTAAAKAYAIIHGPKALTELGRIANGDRPCADDVRISFEEFEQELGELDLSFLLDDAGA